MNVFLSDGRLRIEAETPAEGFWLSNAVQEAVQARLDIRYETSPDGKAALLVPLKQRESLPESKGNCFVCGEPVYGFSWWTKNPAKHPDAIPVHDECFTKTR